MPTGRTNLRVSLSSDSATPDYSWDTYDEPELYDEETITYFNRSANAATTEYSYSGKEDGDRLYQCNGVEANYYLFNCRISYKLYWSYYMGTWYPPQLEDHIQEIAEALHLGHSVHGRNFYVACDEFQVEPQPGSTIGRRYETHEGTVSELLDRLIGWSRDIPMLQYSVRITGNALTVYERGYENNTVNLDTTGKLRRDPTYTVRSVYTAWNSGGSYIYSSDRTLTKAPFTGTKTWGNRSLTYQDGYLTTEAITGTGGTTTTFTYGTVGNSEGKYLMSKTVTGEDETVVTEYTYYQTANEVYLGVERETKTSGNVVDSIIETTHTPLGNGWYGTTTYDKTDGENEVISTSMGQGAPGGKVSQYMVDSQQEGLTNNSDINDRRVAILGLARLRSTYPVHDVATLRRIANAIDNYNGCTEYTATVDVYKLTTVVDIDTLVTLNNKTWYVQSNNVEITPLHKLQRLTLVRWEV